MGGWKGFFKKILKDFGKKKLEINLGNAWYLTFEICWKQFQVDLW